MYFMKYILNRPHGSIAGHSVTLGGVHAAKATTFPEPILLAILPQIRFSLYGAWCDTLALRARDDHEVVRVWVKPPEEPEGRSQIA